MNQMTVRESLSRLSSALDGVVNAVEVPLNKIAAKIEQPLDKLTAGALGFAAGMGSLLLTFDRANFARTANVGEKVQNGPAIAIAVTDLNTAFVELSAAASTNGPVDARFAEFAKSVRILNEAVQPPQVIAKLEEK